MINLMQIVTNSKSVQNKENLATNFTNDHELKNIITNLKTKLIFFFEQYKNNVKMDLEVDLRRLDIIPKKLSKQI